MKNLNMTSGVKRGFEAAKAASRLSNFPIPGKRMGAALLKSGAILATASNQYKTHPDARTPKFLCAVHAEHSALLKRQYYSETTSEIMYIYREIFNKPACSKPCARCQKFMREAGIKRVRYFNEDGFPEEMRL